MPALFVIAHAPLASALHAAARHVYADCDACLVSYDVRADASAAESEAEADAALRALGPQPVLILTDVFGATPCNVATHLAERPDARLVAGVNLPMLWRALNHRHQALDDLLELAVAGGRMGVMQVAVSAPQNQARTPFNHDPNDRHDQQ